ncbi:MAG: hypothetical protein IKQ31_04270 [Clostridia bacterium]|nr:hypothetical protein [Clostridia bacterium]
MGNFTDRVFQWLKTQDSRDGCVKKGLIAAFSLVLIGVVCILTVCHSMPKEDEELTRLLDLLNKDYIPYVNEITQQDRAEFDSKIQNNVVCANGELYTNKKLNVDQFLSSDITLNQNLSFTPKDLAILLGYSWQEDNIVDIYSASMYSEDSMINWILIFKLNVNNAFEESNILTEKLGKDVFIKFSAKVYRNGDIGEWQAFQYNVQVNKLSGANNDFAVKKILEILKIETKTLKAYAVYPFSFCKKQANIWSVNFTFSPIEKIFSFSVIT